MNVKNKSKSRQRGQADGQNTLLVFSDSNNELIKTVFPRMASENILIVAKSDKLIRAFGSRYLKAIRKSTLSQSYLKNANIGSFLNFHEN